MARSRRSQPREPFGKLRDDDWAAEWDETKDELITGCGTDKTLLSEVRDCIGLVEGGDPVGLSFPLGMLHGLLSGIAATKSEVGGDPGHPTCLLPEIAVWRRFLSSAVDLFEEEFAFAAPVPIRLGQGIFHSAHEALLSVLKDDHSLAAWRWDSRAEKLLLVHIEKEAHRLGERFRVRTGRRPAPRPRVVFEDRSTRLLDLLNKQPMSVAEAARRLGGSAGQWRALAAELKRGKARIEDAPEIGRYVVKLTQHGKAVLAQAKARMLQLGK